jgi:hypothetical protein
MAFLLSCVSVSLNATGMPKGVDRGKWKLGRELTKFQMGISLALDSYLP